ncbi:MAG: hypothetical protein MJ150_06840 [Clostridia bacterium]|nr:hypothetical protein [Clostridia bacterium]
MQETRKKKWPYVLTVIFIIVVAALYVYLYLIPSVTGSLTPTYIVESGTFTERDADTKCFVVRDEQVFYAEKTGSLSYYSKETEKTRKGFVVADVYAGNKYSMACPSTGFVSYYIDGYENYFTPNSIGSLNVDEYIGLDIVPENTVRNEAQIGEPVYKIVKSNTWYMLLVVPEDKMGLYTINSNINIYFSDEPTDFVKAKVVRFLGEGATRIVVASTKQYHEDFAKLRTITVQVDTKSYSGLTVPTTAIAYEEEKQGVYVLGVDEEYVFKEIEVLYQSDDLEYTLISDTGDIKLYDEILRDVKQNDATKDTDNSETN